MDVLVVLVSMVGQSFIRAPKYFYSAKIKICDVLFLYLGRCRIQCSHIRKPLALRHLSHELPLVLHHHMPLQNQLYYSIMQFDLQWLFIVIEQNDTYVTTMVSIDHSCPAIDVICTSQARPISCTKWIY